MSRQIRMMIFHLRQFISVPYFIQLMLLTTITTTMVQYLAATAFGQIAPTQGWVRGGIIGMWTTATCAAGIIGFERYKGTLVQLVLASCGALRVLAAVVAAAASFGLAALPVAWLTWAMMSASVSFTPVDGALLARLIGGALLFWIAALALSFVIAALFVLTPNAISYEGLLLVPVFIASGIVFTSTSAPAWVTAIGHLIPLSVPVELLYGRSVGAVAVAGWLAGLFCWFLLAALLGRKALRLATRTGTLELI